MAVTLSATTSLLWATRVFGRTSPAELARLAEDANIESAPLFLPHLDGERTPHNDAGARGMFFGLSTRTSLADMAYSVLEGVAFSLADGYEALRATGTRITEAVIVGGGSKSRFWGSLVASICGFPLARPTQADLAGAIGAARLARVATTGEPIDRVCVALDAADTIRPTSGLAQRMAPRHERYKRLYASTRGLL